MYLGVDVFLGEGLWRRYTGRRVSVMTNISGVTSGLRYSVEELLSRGLLIEGVLAPEHGFWGIYSAGEPVPHTHDDYLGLDVYSLYRAPGESVDSILERSEAVIVDIQDLGLRFYTYVSALIELLEKASRKGVGEVVVLDRPNPLGGEVVEGPVAKPGLYSYVARYSIPVRHGATLGELALLYNTETGLGLDIRVVEARGWRRGLDYIDLGIDWVPPSPAIPGPATVYTYGATVYLEGTNISEGRGTYTPFRVFGAPFIDPRRLSERLNREVRNLYFRPVYFRPLFSKHQGLVCGGVYIHILDRKRLRLFETGMRILRVVTELYRDYIEFLKTGDRYYIDLLVADPRGREVVEGRRDLEDLLSAVEDEVREYRERLSTVALYR